MMRWLRRLFWLGVLGGGGYGAYRMLADRQSSSTSASPSSSAGESTWSPARNHTAEPAPAARWVAPLGADCPAGYPIKVNESSGIYHLPGGRFYDRTAADRCYANADDATADGYRPAKA